MTTFTLELPEETVERLRADAEMQGVDAAELLRVLVEQRYAATPGTAQSGEPGDEEPPKTLAQALDGLIGTVHSGGKDRLPEETGHAFTDYVIRKKREGRL